VITAVAAAEAALTLGDPFLVEDRGDPLSLEPDVVRVDEVDELAADHLVAVPAEQPLERHRHATEARLEVEYRGEVLGHRLLAPPLDVGHQNARRLGQGVEQVVVGRTRLGIEHGERADGEAARLQGDTRVEADGRLPRHPRVGLQGGLGRGILDDQGAVLVDHAPAERDPPPHMRQARAVSRLDPLAVGVDEGDRGDRRAGQAGGHGRDPVELGLGGRAQDVKALQGLHSLSLIRVRRISHSYAEPAQKPPLASSHAIATYP
jgi:hypothetical protein